MPPKHGLYISPNTLQPPITELYNNVLPGPGMLSQHAQPMRNSNHSMPVPRKFRVNDVMHPPLRSEVQTGGNLVQKNHGLHALGPQRVHRN